MISYIKTLCKQIQCKHQYEVLYEYVHSSFHPHYGQSREEMYKLYCPYCDKVDFESKDSKDNREEIQRLKDEIKKRVLGVDKND